MARDLIPLHRAALTEAGEMVRRIAPGDLGGSTPCGDWTLADLLCHMVGQHHGFAAAARDGDAPAGAYAPRPFTLENWDASVAELLAAFEPADPDGTAILIEIAPIALPMNRVIGAQLLDTAVHTWDLARSLGESYEPDPDIARAVADIARSVPDGARRTQPNSAFAPAKHHSGSEWEQALAHLGRDPYWQPIAPAKGSRTRGRGA